MKRLIALFFIFGFLQFPAAAQAEPAHDKLSPRLRMLTGSRPDLVEFAKQRVRLKHLKTASEDAEPVVDTMVLFEGDPKTLEALGARVRSVLGNVATMGIPLGALENLANHPNVVRIEEARQFRPRLDISVPETGANSVWGSSSRPLPPPWAGNTGRNVVVGIVDTGIDLKHADFKDAFGKSRVLYVWDQTVDGAPPAGFSYGSECTKQQIDAKACKEKDRAGHGTHVAGIAAGDGSGTSHSQPAYRYIGMAPESNLIVVKTTFFGDDIIDGIAYIQNKAAELSLPSVVNLSLVGHFGPHDGTSIFETAVDNASGPGTVIVAAVGNEAESQIHASGTVADGGTTTVSFNVPNRSKNVFLDVWYPGGDQIGVKVTGPFGSCSTSDFRYPADDQQISNTGCGLIIISTPPTNAANGDNEIIIELAKGTLPVRAGTWTFTLNGGGCGSSPCVNDGTYDVWIDDITSDAFFMDPDPSKTMGMPATATKVIAAASYKTKDCWNSIRGLFCYYGQPEGAISDFSSLGPRRTCSNTANCPATQKPDLAAPGEGIVSAFSASTTDPNIKASALRDPDRQHAVLQGTSMASPHVAGAAALLLAQNTALTSDDVKFFLTMNPKTDSFTETPDSTPNDTWGYGKLAVNFAIGGAGTNLPPDPAPAAPTGIAAVAGRKSATISWTGITGDIFLNGYNVYWSTTSGGPYTKANSTIISKNSYKVTGLTPAIPYYFVVTSVDTPDIESDPFLSTEVTATPR